MDFMPIYAKFKANFIFAAKSVKLVKEKQVVKSNKIFAITKRRDEFLQYCHFHFLTEILFYQENSL